MVSDVTRSTNIIVLHCVNAGTVEVTRRRENDFGLNNVVVMSVERGLESENRELAQPSF